MAEKWKKIGVISMNN